MPPSEATVQYEDPGDAGDGPGGPGGPGGAGRASGGPGSPAGPLNAWTWVLEAASSRPAPTEGVGKWLDTEPMRYVWTGVPSAGFSPYSSPDWVIVHTRPPATIGGPGEPVGVCHPVVSQGVVGDVWTASTPELHGA